LSRHAVQLARRVAAGDRIVDDLVDGAREAVQRVRRGAGPGRQQPGREEEGAPVVRVDPTGFGVGGAQGGFGDPGSVSSLVFIGR
jgi:hypothetical protein